jgi:hypothetical protein
MTHVLDPGADHNIVHARGDLRGGEVDGLLCGAALTIDRRRRRARGKARLQPGVARHVLRLLANLRRAAGDRVLHQLRRDPCALDDGGVAGAQEVVRVDVGVVARLTLAAADRRARRRHDHNLPANSLSHHVLLVVEHSRGPHRPKGLDAAPQIYAIRRLAISCSYKIYLHAGVPMRIVSNHEFQEGLRPKASAHGSSGARSGVRV